MIYRALLILFCSFVGAFAQFFENQQPTSQSPFTFFHYHWFAVGYSEETHTPLWTAYEVQHCDIPTVTCSRPPKFKSEPSTTVVIKHEDYSGTGYSRGHMVPNAAMAYCHNDCKAAEATFIMTNVVPQLQAHNGGVWERLESEISGLKNASGFKKGLAQKVSKAWVYTGPVFFKEKKAIAKISKKEVYVPSHLWKTVIWENQQGERHTCSWVIPHEGNIPKNAHMQYTTSIKKIHEMCGVNVFGADMAHPLYEKVEDELFTQILKDSDGLGQSNGLEIREEAN